MRDIFFKTTYKITSLYINTFNLLHDSIEIIEKKKVVSESLLLEKFGTNS